MLIDFFFFFFYGLFSQHLIWRFNIPITEVKPALLNHGCNVFFPALTLFTCCLCPLAFPLAPPAAGRRVPWLSCGEGDALRVQVVHQLGSSQADSGRLESLLELRQDQRLVLEDLSVQSGVRQDKGAHCLEAILEAICRLRGRDATIAVWVAIGGEAQFWIGPDERGKWLDAHTAAKFVFSPLFLMSVSHSTPDIYFTMI